MTNLCDCCNALNRPHARYCKGCGVVLVGAVASSPANVLDDLVGLAALKTDIDSKITVAQRMRKMGWELDKKVLHTILIGNTGTAKSHLAEMLARHFFNNQILARPDCHTVKAVDYAAFAKDLPANLAAAKGGLLFVDEVHKLVPADYIPGQTTAMDRLYNEMDRLAGDPVIVLAARPQGFKDYLDKNPEVRHRFSLIYNLPDLSAEEMYLIAQRQLQKQNLTLSPEAGVRLNKVFQRMVRTKDSHFGNGHSVNRVVKKAIEQHFLNPRCEAFPGTLLEEDIKGEIDEQKTTEQILSELDDQLIGLADVKVYIRNLIKRINVARQDAEKTGKRYVFGEHLIFTGNPGTGKTTLARKLGEVFASIGLLDRGHVAEVDRGRLVGQYVGETAKLVHKTCDEALGGILFVDEAYTLKQHDNDHYGQEAIDTLLKRMEDDRGRMMVIAAGYRNEMQKFIDANPGLKSRFKEENLFELNDYNPDEMLSIFRRFADKDHYDLQTEAEQRVRKALQALYDRRDKNFGNARDVRNFYEQCLSQRAIRLQQGASHDLVIREDDIPLRDELESIPSADEALKELNGLTGLQSVKQEISRLIDYLEAERLRAAEGGKKSAPNLHFVFKGNPGTGKTTVARILARVFKALGLLPRGQLVEIDRKDLVAEYVGQTAVKANKVIESALGGVLFIDEAYTLASDNFGKEAIDTLLKRMEDDRGKFIVIVAGYDAEMDRFLQSNPGLPSRFSHQIRFEDYQAEEMVTIFRSFVLQKGMRLEEGVDPCLPELFQGIYHRRDRNFANGRTVRQLFEVVLRNQAGRVAAARKQGIDVSDAVHCIAREDLGL